MKTVLLDGAQIHTRVEFHEELARQLGFPLWYGKNLDALFDCLTDIQEETWIQIQNTEKLEANLGKYWAGIQKVFCDAQKENEYIRF